MNKIYKNSRNEEFIKLFNENKTLEEICKIMNLTKGGIWYYCRKNKLYFGGKGSSTRKFIEVNPFSANDEESWYWLGYIAADGCITKKVNGITLISKDREHLEKYRAFLQKHAEKDCFIKLKYQHSGCYTVSFSNKITKDYLISLGITPKKS